METNKKAVLFLDNDGVICLSNNWGGRSKKWSKYKKLNPDAVSDTTAPVEVRFNDFDKKAVKMLNQVLEETGAELVVSSDWRLHATLEEIGEYYLSKGILKAPITFTKRYIGCDKPDEFEWKRSTMYEQQRCIEVKQYLTDHPDITHWACIDDLELGEKDSYGFDRKWGLSNFVHTPRENDGIKQSGVKNYVILDDDNDFLTHQRGNFVRTANNINHPDSINIGYGLTNECANKAIRILNG